MSEIVLDLDLVKQPYTYQFFNKRFLRVPLWIIHATL